MRSGAVPVGPGALPGRSFIEREKRPGFKERFTAPPPPNLQLGTYAVHNCGFNCYGTPHRSIPEPVAGDRDSFIAGFPRHRALRIERAAQRYPSTGVTAGLPSSTAITFSATSRAIASLAVAVADPTCGSRTTFSSSSSAGSTSGSCS